MAGVDRVEVHGDELVIAVADGAAAISPVAVALATPAIQVAGPHAAHPHARRRVPRAHRQPHPSDESDRHERPPRPHPSVTDVAIRARAAGFCADLVSVAGRAVRGCPREPEAVIPALIIPVFFFVVNVGALQDFAESRASAGLRLQGLPAAGGDHLRRHRHLAGPPTLVIDIQDGYFDRLLLTPIRRLALLLGLMVADFVLVVALSIPVMILGFALGVRFETGLARRCWSSSCMAGLWGARVHRLPVRDRAQDRQPGRGERRASSCSSRSPSSPRRSSRRRRSPAGSTRSHCQPGHLPARRAALARARRLGRGGTVGGRHRHRRRRHRVVHARVRDAAGPPEAELTAHSPAASVAPVALLAERVAVHVVAVALPEPGLVAGRAARDRAPTSPTSRSTGAARRCAPGRRGSARSARPRSA